MRQQKEHDIKGFIKVWTFVLLALCLCVVSYASPTYTKDVVCPALGKLGTMVIDTYSEYKVKWVGGVEISGQFNEQKNLIYHYIQSINSWDDPTPKKYKDGSTLPVPLIDTPPGGYQNDPFDYKVYYDETEFPQFYDKPSTYMLDAKDEADKKLGMSFETWLVCVCSESFGSQATKAKDDSYKVAPLLGWTWGYDITYADDGDEEDELVDFTVTKEAFAWKTTPSTSWKTALGAKYSSGANEDFFNVSLCECENCEVVPAPPAAFLVLFGAGFVMRNRRFR